MYRRKTTVIIVMCVMMLFMGIGYAILSTKLNINGNTAVTSTWKVEFSGISVASTTGGATSKSSSYSATTVNFEVDLVQPGDELTYNVNITNYGDIKAEVKGATYTATDNDAIYVRIKGIEKGTILESCEGLTTCPTKTLTITVGYNPGVEKDPSNKTKDISLTLQVGQYIAGNPTESGELIPEASESLVTKILSNNSAMSDANIDFTKGSPVPIYKEYHVNSTTSLVFSTSTKYYFANAYTFDETTGRYSLAGDVIQETWSSTMVQKYPYTCQSSSNVCYSFIYKLASYSSSTSGFGYNYTSKTSDYDTKTNGLGLYYTSTNTEDNRVTYYFRGAVENNYVSFAGSTWRIIRINEDGSVRLIKQDTIGESAFNTNGDKAYIGYMYGTLNATTTAEVNTNTNSSTIKTYLDTWYKNNLISYSSYLADSGFCGDRSVTSGLGYGTTSAEYGAYNRLDNNKSPQFKCPQSNDLYTTSTATKGNKALTYPIGLITADEVAYAGGISNITNEHYYLVIDGSFWTMSPSHASSLAYLWVINKSGSMGSSGSAEFTVPVRPVINLKSTVTVLSGDGTKTNPYIIN